VFKTKIDAFWYS